MCYCEADEYYTEAILRDVLYWGLEDSEIQLDLLGDKNQDMSLEQVLRVVEAKEVGKRSATHLLLPRVTNTTPDKECNEGPITERSGSLLIL